MNEKGFWRFFWIFASIGVVLGIGALIVALHFLSKVW